MQKVTGHCFRIGGTTALLRRGVDPEVVKVAGRWRSDSFLRYWRTIDTMISSHMDLCDVYWLADADAPVFYFHKSYTSRPCAAFLSRTPRALPRDLRQRRMADGRRLRRST